MVVGLALAAVQMGMALPTGFLFGVGYGTGVRIGYEQVYPLLFPKGARPTTTELAATMKGMNTVYDAIGGKDASRMGIAVGIINAGDILNNPDFQVLEKLESSSSGPTSSNSNRLASGRGALDQSDNSLSETEQFNLDTNADIKREILEASYEELIQLRLIYKHGTTDKAKLYMTLTGQELLKRTEADNANLGTGPQTEITRGPPSLSVQEANKKFLNDEFIAWNQQVNKDMNLLLQWKNELATALRAKEKALPSNRALAQKRWNTARSKYTKYRKIITAYSNQYRSSNNGIRNVALNIRQLIAKGLFT